MPWHIGKSDECPTGRPFAVIKDDDGDVEGCHESEADAQDQIAALYANEGEAQVITSDDVIYLLDDADD